MSLKLCNKAKTCQYHMNKCDHRKLHSDMDTDNPVLRESAGLQKHCMHYPDQQCIEIEIKSIKER